MKTCTAFLALTLLAFTACKRPEAALKERPLDAVRYVQKGAPSGTSRELSFTPGARLAEGLAAPLNSPEPMSSGRILSVEIDNQNPNLFLGTGLAKTWAIDVGMGGVVGLFIVSGGGRGISAMTPNTAAIGAGVGALAGFAYGPYHFRSNQALFGEMGYLPWAFSGRWRVIEPRPKGSAIEIAKGPLPYLDLKPFLTPLPAAEAKNPSKVRQACLLAYEEALLHHLAKHGVTVAKAPTPRAPLKPRSEAPPAVPPTIPVPAS